MRNNARQEWIQQRTVVLESSIDPQDLELAAADLASSDDPEALEALGTFLRRGDFLERLDNPDDPAGKTTHLRTVLLPLIEHPSPEVARLCLSIVDDPDWLANDRKSFLLQALAAVVPMNAETVEAFRRANEEGYFAFN